MTFIPFAFSRTLKHTLPRHLPQKEEDHPRQQMVEDIPSRRNSTLPNKKAYPQSALRLTAPSAEGAFGSLGFTRYGINKNRQGRMDANPFCPAAFFPSHPAAMVAAALSAAVTSTKPIGEQPHSQAEPTKKKDVPQTPAALREGARGRGFSQRSRLPRSSPTPRFFEREREGGGFL